MILFYCPTILQKSACKHVHKACSGQEIEFPRLWGFGGGEKLSGNFWRLSQSLASTTTSGPPLLLLAADDLDGGWRRTVLTGKGPRVMWEKSSDV
ncbi:hypothetical protein TNIN_342741 [Trichonephila inaurata madagascariensis]|uniref:Uncharacterized protein n=1 Tax=Trichonephila inaurata madagascariensis TaxID=2747483 RepID=A0A8X7BPG2_9ARAC|nr:hypothetical protein TNIN_461721 [Trichonephila inaurata madagascariensis]GFY50668.1 hypothetical protein TNIN_342741 [Trichonephila inaurata madagascariensis]